MFAKVRNLGLAVTNEQPKANEQILDKQGLKSKGNPDSQRNVCDKAEFDFTGSTEKLRTRIGYDTYAKPSDNFENDRVCDPELDFAEEEGNDDRVVHHDQRLFSSVDID